MTSVWRLASLHHSLERMRSRLGFKEEDIFAKNGGVIEVIKEFLRGAREDSFMEFCEFFSEGNVKGGGESLEGF